MPDLAAGTPIRALDFPPTVAVTDGTGLANLGNTTYAPGSPEVGVSFVAPTTGRVITTVGAGVRNNTATADRIFVTVQVLEGPDNAGTEFLAPSVPYYGVSSATGATTSDFQYLSRAQLVDGLTPGATYYARIMHAVTGGTTCDLAGRTLMIQPAT